MSVTTATDIRACHSKRRFPTWQWAREMALVYLDQRGIYTRPYRCPECKQWHLSSTTKTTTRAREMAT